MEETVKGDLDGDGMEEEIRVEYVRNNMSVSGELHLCINEKDFYEDVIAEQHGENPCEDNFFVASLAPEEDWMAIGIQYDGPSNDRKTDFYRYQKGKLELVEQEIYYPIQHGLEEGDEGWYPKLEYGRLERNLEESGRGDKNMGKRFNTSADCKPELHYMVDIKERLAEIKAMVDRGDYFTINRARQYGKTTILRALSSFLKQDYRVISLDFQLLGAAKFKNEQIFSTAFAKMFLKACKKTESEESESFEHVVEVFQLALQKEAEFELLELFEYISELCQASKKPIVLLIDEIDSATNNQVFLDFLSQMRGHYIDRDQTPTFQSVILAGVYDVKNIKQKIRTEAEHKVNSPWNVAVEFLVDMSFSVTDIKGMLAEYEKDYQTGMEIGEIAKLLYDYTSGYPFLVSRLCQLMDEVLPKELMNKREMAKKVVWTKEGVTEAVKWLLSESNTLFDDMIKKLADFPELKKTLYHILFQGQRIPYSIDNYFIGIGQMFGFIKNVDGMAVIANRIFETRLYNLFLSEEIVNSKIYDAADLEKNRFIQEGHLKMELVLERFVEAFTDIYSDEEESFLEENGRRFFLLYLKPIINGVGNYYIEARTRNMERTDVIVDYRGEQFVIELKIWRGNAYHERGEKQLLDYLDYYHLKKGYMLSFNFNKRKQSGIKEILLGDKILVEAIV